MNKILYLVHATNNFNINWGELKPSSIKKSYDQFPGVYFSIITKNNLKNQQLYTQKNILIFSKKLLEQENYHININDYNGFINEKNTYYPWNLNKAISKINSKKNTMNEVVFHDPISLKYLCINFQITNINSKIKINDLLPKYPIYNDEEPDKTKLPFYCIPLENNFTGYGKYDLSSIKFYKKMAILCNVDTNQTREKIIEDIKEKMVELYNNRNQQKLLEFKKLIK